MAERYRLGVGLWDVRYVYRVCWWRHCCWRRRPDAPIRRGRGRRGAGAPSPSPPPPLPPRPPGRRPAGFTHWAEQGNKCDTRETVLERDGTGVGRDGECRAVSGTWKSLYDGVVVTDAAKMDIDHIVPLAEGWRSGASGWDAARRKAFANDLTRPQLLAVTASSNRSKGDQSPDLWQPPDRSSWCQYGRAWTTVKSAYELTVTEPEKRMLTTMLDTCAS